MLVRFKFHLLYIWTHCLGSKLYVFSLLALYRSKFFCCRIAWFYFSNKPRDWLTWPIWCQVECKTLTRSILGGNDTQIGREIDRQTCDILWVERLWSLTIITVFFLQNQTVSFSYQQALTRHLDVCNNDNPNPSRVTLDKLQRTASPILLPA